jgi:hypothetical protein
LARPLSEDKRTAILEAATEAVAVLGVSAPIRSEEGWRVPQNRMRALGIRIYTAAEIEENRRRSEHRR